MPELGDRIRVISGWDAGRTGEVLMLGPAEGLKPYEFFIFSDRPDLMRRVRAFGEELFQKVPGAPTPRWLPPLSLEDLASLDNMVVRFCEDRWKAAGSTFPAFYALVAGVWRARLPVEAHEIRALLVAHGVSVYWCRRLAPLFHHGRASIVEAAGRPPIKKKRGSGPRP